MSEAPRPGAVSSLMDPPCASAMPAAMASPSPVVATAPAPDSSLSADARKNGSKTRSATSAGHADAVVPHLELGPVVLARALTRTCAPRPGVRTALHHQVGRHLPQAGLVADDHDPGSALHR